MGFAAIAAMILEAMSVASDLVKLQEKARSENREPTAEEMTAARARHANWRKQWDALAPKSDDDVPINDGSDQ